MNRLLLACFLAACTPGPLEPKDPLWNRENCAHCGMGLSEPRYAAQVIGPGRRVRYFDDLGCALALMRTHPELGKGSLYVRPQGGTRWIAAQDARYRGGLQTPMAFFMRELPHGTVRAFFESR